MKDKELIISLELHKQVLINYLKMKLRDSDWHGIMDAAADIREIDAKLAILRL